MTQPHLPPEVMARAREIVALYPHPRSALIPLCHLAQEQDGWLRPEAMAEIAELVGITPAEVLGTATFYDMLHTEEVGRYVVTVCTNIACMLRGAYELLEHAEQTLGIRTGATSADGSFTLEDAECLADCGRAPCLQVNHRFFGDVTHDDFDRLVDDLREGRLDDEVPRHGTLVRVRRDGGLRVDAVSLRTERQAAAAAMADRAAASESKAAAAASESKSSESKGAG
ncbi:MAG TPA: NAD(P)H-dependent oxidoreductase subunit E [Acidimicrobiales bacterium]|nr:NAD(P)H-dependent oxidoreductase subunit E [Acidimicrobiales bacterium]